MADSPLFSERLHQFALSVDFINADQFRRVQQQLIDYAHKRLGAVQVALFTGVPLRGRVPGIAEAEGWSSPPFPIDEGRARLRDESGRYPRQLALALGEQRDLWVVTDTDRPLDERNPGRDVLGADPHEVLPKFYPAPGNAGSKTAIVWNAKQVRQRRAAVLVLEWSTVVLPWPWLPLRSEIAYLAEAAGLLQATYEHTRERSTAGTDAALHALAELARSSRRLDFKPPVLFFAYSAKANDDVVRATKEVLREDEFAQKVSLSDWTADQAGGSIWNSITKSIGSATYGIAYLSEPRKVPGRPRFQDNLNVVMEAGMLQVTTASKLPTGEATGAWIPIRETDADDAFFDVAGLRMILVPRAPDGTLDTDSLKKTLRDRLRGMLV